MFALPARFESEHYKDTKTDSQFIEVVILKKISKTTLALCVAQQKYCLFKVHFLALVSVLILVTDSSVSVYVCLVHI